jgi:putative ABC transport system permease protein
MRFFGYILRNARRNPVRSILTIASITVSLFLMMIILSFLQINTDVSESVRIYNRIVTMSSQGFAQPVPIVRVREIAAMPGVVAVTPFSWYGGKYGEDPMPFAQFGIDPESVFKIYDELTVAPDQIKAFQEDRAGCIIGRKLSEEKKIKIGDALPLKGGVYPFDLRLTVRGVYDGPFNSDRRMCLFHWSYIDEGLKRDFKGVGSGNAGIVVIKCKNADTMAPLSKRIDDLYRNSDTPTRTQSEEAFGKMFAEMFGDMRWYIGLVGIAVVVALVCVGGVSMAMAMRERTTEIAVLKAIGYGKSLVLFLVMAEALIVAATGGVLGSLGSKALFDSFDISPYSGGFLPFFYVPWSIATIGLVSSLFVGLASGVIPAVLAARMSVINGLRKVV